MVRPASETGRPTGDDRPLIRIARILAAVVLGYATLVFFIQRAVAFPGQYRSGEVDRPPEGVHPVWLETSFGRVEAWRYGTGAVGVVFFHGNGELIDDWVPDLQRLADAGPTVLAVEFPGYGRSDGRPSRATIREAAAAAFDHLAGAPEVDADRIVAWGRSMGGGAAADLALDRPVAALVLHSTFSSTMAMAATVGVPGFLVRDRFAPREAVARYQGPILLMHGPDDEVIPYREAERTAAARPGLQIIDLPCGHNDCASEWPSIVQTVLAFLSAEGVTP